MFFFSLNESLLHTSYVFGPSTLSNEINLLTHTHTKKKERKKRKGKQETNGKDKQEACFKNFNGIRTEDRFQIGLE